MRVVEVEKKVGTNLFLHIYIYTSFNLGLAIKHYIYLPIISYSHEPSLAFHNHDLLGRLLLIPAARDRLNSCGWIEGRSTINHHESILINLSALIIDMLIE